MGKAFQEGSVFKKQWWQIFRCRNLMDVYYPSFVSVTRTFLFLHDGIGHFSVTQLFVFRARGAFEGTSSSISTNWSCLPNLQSLPPQRGALVKLISASKFFTPESAKKDFKEDLIHYWTQHYSIFVLVRKVCWLQLGAFELQLYSVSCFPPLVFSVLWQTFPFENE